VTPIEPARDIPFPGTIRLNVDTTQVARGIFHVKETVPVPVQTGMLTLLYPKFVPGNHSASNPINKIAGIFFSVGGKRLTWLRDPVEVNAFHVDVPVGAKSIDVAFDYLSPTAMDQGRIQTTDTMMDLQWIDLVLYPAGYFARRISVEPTLTLPSGWKAGTALASDSSRSAADTIAYKPIMLDTLLDSPVVAGKFLSMTELASNVTLYAAAADPSENQPPPPALA
jgi:predicted metalloprotease with PDZ domain